MPSTGYDVAERSARTGCAPTARAPGNDRAPQLTWCVQRLVGSPASSTSSAVDEPNRLLCAERGDHPVRPARHSPENDLPRWRRSGASPAGEAAVRPTPPRSRARRPSRDRRRAGRGRRHRAHVRHPGDDAPARARRHDVIGQAKTGTGKTLGFGLPLLQRVTVPRTSSRGRRRGRRPADRTPRRRSSSCRPASCASRSPTTSPTPAPSSASASPRSTAAAPTSRRSRPCARASTWSSAPPAGCSTSPSSAT